jgi:hypothetical protein
LVNHAVGAFVEFLAVFGRPPHFQIAFGVILAAAVVETVRDFVTDNRAD